MKIRRTRIILIKSFDTIPGATPERMVASGMVCTHPIYANQHLSVSEISENQRYARTPENQGTHSLYLALDCKCAFGAINMLGLQYKKILKEGNVSKSIFVILQWISFGFPLISLARLSGAAGARWALTMKIKGKLKEISCKIENIDFGAFRSLGIFLYCNPNMFIH